MKTVTWTTKGAHEITVTLELVGDTINHRLSLDGANSKPAAVTMSSRHAGYVAVIGSVPLTREQLDMIMSAGQELRQTPVIDTRYADLQRTMDVQNGVRSW